MNHEGVCRTAPATPGLLNTSHDHKKVAYALKKNFKDIGLKTKTVVFQAKLLLKIKTKDQNSWMEMSDTRVSDFLLLKIILDTDDPLNGFKCGDFLLESIKNLNRKWF